MNFLKRLHDVVTPWELLLLSSVAYVLFNVPFEAAFHQDPSSLELAIDVVISFFFLIDALTVKRNLIFVKSEMSSKIIRLLMVFPLETILYFLNHGSLNGAISWVVYAQALRFLILPSLVVAIHERGKAHIIPKRFKFLSAAVITAVVLNFLACGWLVIYPPREDFLTAYNKALYWLITTIATVGYGDITPTTNVGRLYTMGVMILGATIWGILIASASRLMLASDLRKQQKKEKMEALHSFLSHYEVPARLQREVVGFFNHQWARTVSEEERAIIKDLPPGLQQELQTIMNLKPLSQIRLFRNVSHDCLREVSARLEQVFFSPGDQIIRKDENGEEMYIIGHGTVNVHLGDQHITGLGQGACFGEMALIGDSKRTTDVTAASYCDLFKLNKSQLDELMASHADLKDNVMRIVQERQEKLKKDSARRMVS
jgi:voltage-gated potassium channel